MERQEGIFHHVLWEGVARCRRSFHKARLVLEGCFDQLVDQIVREIGAPDYKIRHSDGDIVLVQEAVIPPAIFAGPNTGIVLRMASICWGKD